MKSYNQYCGLALALERVGDRWTMLIIRELLVAPRRFSELRRALPGIAPNLLSGRIKQLQADGLVERHRPPPPARGTWYRLTDLGVGLEEAVLALVRWGGTFMRQRGPEAVFQPQWLVVALKAILSGASCPTPLAVEIRVDGAVLSLSLATDGATLDYGSGLPAADLRIAGSPEAILGLFAGEIPTARAVEIGLIQGGPAAEALGSLARVLARE